MKFVIAPDKFKGSLTGFEFCNAVEEGLKLIFNTDSTILKMPMADGGDGTMEVIAYYLNGKKIAQTVQDPLGRHVQSEYLFATDRKVAFIEMAEASGLKLLNANEYNCLETSSYGTGELIVDAIENGAEHIILGIGGSATNDGGMGMAAALGYKFLDVDAKPLLPVGKNLIKVNSIDDSQVHEKLKHVTVEVACDVTNPFYGYNGAAHIYAPQKGASKEDVFELDRGLRNFSEVVLQKYTVDLQKIKGAGAAGGLGGGAVIFLQGNLVSGIDLIKGLANFDEAIEGSDWIITGEGRLDGQTLTGKTIHGVVQSAAKKNIPVAALCGSNNMSIEEQNRLGVHYIDSVVQGVSTLEEAMKSSYSNLVFASYNFARLL